MTNEEIRLRPDLSVVYEHKEALKRPIAPIATPLHRRPLTLWSSIAAAAAVVAVGVLLLRPVDAPLVPADRLVVAKVEPSVAPSDVDVVAKAEPIVTQPEPKTVGAPPVVGRRAILRHATGGSGAPTALQAEKPQTDSELPRHEQLIPIAAEGTLLAMTPAEQPLTLQLERPAAAEASFAILELPDRHTARRLFDDIGEKGVIALNALAGRKTMVTKTYDAEGRLLSRDVTSLGMTMSRSY